VKLISPSQKVVEPGQGTKLLLVWGRVKGDRKVRRGAGKKCIKEKKWMRTVLGLLTNDLGHGGTWQSPFGPPRVLREIRKRFQGVRRQRIGNPLSACSPWHGGNGEPA